MKPIAPQFLTVEQVCSMLSCSRATIWRWSKERADFPKPLKLGPATTRWRTADVEAFLASR